MFSRVPSRAAAAIIAAVFLGACTSGPSADRGDRPQPSVSPTPSPSTSPTEASTRAAPPAGSTPGSTPAPSATTIPPISAQGRAAGLVDIRTVVPDAIIDLRYATTNNFTRVQLYPTNARCLVHTSMVAGLRTAAATLRAKGYRLVFWDCYRPHPVQIRMWQVVPNPAWVAKPGPYATSHEAGRSVDITLAYAATGRTCAAQQRVHDHCLLDMGTGFDDFTPRAYAYATSVSRSAQANRALLRQAMAGGGIVVYRGEWWHFDGPGALVGRPHLNAPLT